MITFWSMALGKTVITIQRQILKSFLLTVMLFITP